MKRARKLLTVLLALSLLFTTFITSAAADDGIGDGHNATITIAADDRYSLYVNGELEESRPSTAGSDTHQWDTAKDYRVTLTSDYVIAVQGEDLFGSIAGLSIKVTIDGQSAFEISDSTWQQTTNPGDGDWTAKSYIMSDWSDVTLLGEDENDGWTTEAGAWGWSNKYTNTDEYDMDKTVYFRYENPTYNVIYNGNESTSGSQEDTTEYGVGEEATVKDAGSLLKTNYTFVNWNTMANGTGTTYIDDPADLITMTATDITLYAQWALVPTYTITYAPGLHGTFAAQVTTGLALDVATPIAPTASGETGWTFTGWDPTPTLTVKDTATYTAQWSEDPTYTVTYEPGLHGTFAAQVTTGLALDVATPIAPTASGETGWTFTGWNPTPTSTVKDTAIYTAQWSEDPTYTITYAPGLHGTFAAQVTTGLALDATTPTQPATPGDAGWSFIGWDPTPATTVTVTATYTAQWSEDPSPVITIDKKVDYESVFVGETITYSVTVTNTGNVPLSNIVVSDPMFDVDGKIGAIAELASGASYSVNGLSYTTTAVGTIDNTATVVATYYMDTMEDKSDGDVVFKDTDGVVNLEESDSVRVTVYETPIEPNPVITIDKLVSSDSVFVGDTVIYSVTVKNTGNVPLSNVVVSDPMFDVDGKIGAIAELAVGDSYSINGLSYKTTAVGTINNTATVVAMFSYWNTMEPQSDGYYTSDDTDNIIYLEESDSVSITVSNEPIVVPSNPSISVSIAPDATLVLLGTDVTFTIVVRNTGDTILNNVTLVNSSLGFNETLTGPLYLLQSRTYNVTKTMDELLTFDTQVNAEGISPQYITVNDNSATQVNVYEEEEEEEEEEEIVPEEPTPGANPETGAVPLTVMGSLSLLLFGSFALFLKKKKNYNV